MITLSSYYHIQPYYLLQICRTENRKSMERIHDGSKIRCVQNTKAHCDHLAHGAVGSGRGGWVGVGQGTGAGASVVNSIVVAIVWWHCRRGVWGCGYARFRGGLNGVGHGTVLMASSWRKWDCGAGSGRVGWDWTGW